MSETKVPPAPRTLGKRGKAFWRDIQGDNELDSPSTEVLLEACRTLDRLEALAEVIDAEGVTATGSAGQRVVHPAVAEARQLQITLTRLVDAIGLPESEDDTRAHEAWKTKRAKAGAAARHGFPLKSVL